MFYGQARAADEQVVVLAQVLSTDVTQGYEDIVNNALQKFNGKKVRNLRHLSQMIEACDDAFLRF